MKIAFFGTPDFTMDFLETLSRSGFKPSLVVTNPDRPSGRGMSLHAPGPKIWAQNSEIEVIQPEKIDGQIIENLKKTTWDFFVVVAYGKILPEALINIPKYGTINVHYSLLPKYRGATPVESAILNSDTVTGITIQQMRFKLDTGPILIQKEITIDPDDTTPSLRQKLNDEAFVLLPEVIKDIFSGTINPVEQSEDNASHCAKIKKEDGLLNLSDAGKINYQKYRAYYGSIGTYFMTNKNGKDTRVKIISAHFENNNFVIDEVVPENGKKMPYSIFVSSL